MDEDLSNKDLLFMPTFLVRKHGGREILWRPQGSRNATNIQKLSLPRVLFNESHKPDSLTLGVRMQKWKHNWRGLHHPYHHISHRTAELHRESPHKKLFKLESLRSISWYKKVTGNFSHSKAEVMKEQKSTKQKWWQPLTGRKELIQSFLVMKWGWTDDHCKNWG